jgi:hypothetical protein
VAFRYDLPPQVSGLEIFVLTRELTESDCGRLPLLVWRGIALKARINIPEGKLSKIPAVTSGKKRAGQPFLSVLPLLARLRLLHVAVRNLICWIGRARSSRERERPPCRQA